MKYLAIFIATLLVGTCIIRVGAWAKGNVSEVTFTSEENASPDDASKPEAGKQYYWKHTVHESRIPSAFPGVWTTARDTTHTCLQSRSAD